MQKMPLTINGVDFSPLTERLGYSISYEDRTGSNTMMMQNGDQYLDIITRRPVLTWRLNSLTSAELESLHAAINAGVYVEVSYYDTASGSVQTGWFHCHISAQQVGVIRNGATYRFHAPTLTMRSR